MEPPLERLGRYRIVRFLARGGMGELYVAVDPSRPGEEVVLKCVRASRRVDQLRGRVRMFLDEAGVATLVNHPNVVRVHAVDYQAGVYYLVMEKLEGRDLAAVMVDRWRCGEQIPVSLVGRLIIDACRGLHAAHECTTDRGEALDLVHRDVSPPNLFVTRDGVLKVLDFGVAKTAIQTRKTRVGVLKGKVAYMSPEQVRGEQLDRRSDVFSVGIVLYELLTGRRLFARASQNDVLRAVLDELIAPPARADDSVDEPLQGVTMRALQRNRNLRYGTALELATALERVIPAAREVENYEVAELVTGIRAANDGATATASVPNADAELLAEWARELSEQITQAGTQPAIEPQRDTVVGWAAGVQPVSKMSTTVRSRLGAAVAGSALLGLVVGIGIGVGVGLRDNERPLPISPSAAQPARVAPQPVESPVAQLPETADVVEPPRSRRRQLTRSARSEQKTRKARSLPVGSPATGMLTLDANPWANVYLGDKLLGTTPLVERKLRVGRVTLRLVNPETGQKRTVTVEIPADGVLRQTVTLE